MGPWVTWMFLLNPVRVAMGLLPFEVGLIGNGVLLVSLMAAYVAIPCAIVGAMGFLLCGHNPCNGGSTDDEGAKLDRGWRDDEEVRPATDAAARRANLTEFELNELRRRAAQEGLHEESLEAAISAYANGKVQTAQIAETVHKPDQKDGKKKISVRARAGERDKKRS